MRTRIWVTLGILCAATIITIVATTIVLLREQANHKETLGSTPSFEDLLRGKVRPKAFNGSWISGKELLYTDSLGNVALYTFGSENSKRILLPAKALMEGHKKFQISADNQYLKVTHAFQTIYRSSYKAHYTIINLRNHTDRTELHISNDRNLLLAIWAPAGNALACVYENNIYYKPNIAGDFIQITKEGEFVYNGIPDWVYEEEVFGSNKALWFSPDGNQLAYGRFDDQEVQPMQMLVYGKSSNSSFQYPKLRSFKYPKAGTRNPTVSLHCVNLTNMTEIKQLRTPSELQNSSEAILSAVTWATTDTVSAIWKNRIQNRAVIVTYSITQDSYNMETIRELREESGWLDLSRAPIFSRDGSQMVLISSSDQEGNMGAYKHIVMLANTKNAREVPLTRGPFVVKQILAWNYQLGKIFYLANTETDFAAQHLYSVSITTRGVECLSCGVKSTHKNLSCSYNLAKFSKDASHYALTCAGPDVPDVAIYSLEKKLLEWNINEEMRNYLKRKRLPTSEIRSFDVAGGFKAQVKLKLPPDLDTSGRRKYPMLVYVYAGPGSSQVTKRFSVDWGSYLAAKEGIIYATIDGRCSGLRGNKILFTCYRRLGTVEIADQIQVTKRIQETLPYIDANRIAVWGASYGGYATGMILANDDKGVFKCGISVSPVTDWTLYDSIYTERYMGLPTDEDNSQGYLNASLLSRYEGIRHKKYFLIHGTLDDNVHYQQSMIWAKILQENNILFRQMSYTDENHFLAKVRQHLYRSMEDFLDECFNKKKNHN